MLLFKPQHMVARMHPIEILLSIFIKINALRNKLKYLKYTHLK